jgi:hypothetical protein
MEQAPLRSLPVPVLTGWLATALRDGARLHHQGSPALAATVVMRPSFIAKV